MQTKYLLGQAYQKAQISEGLSGHAKERLKNLELYHELLLKNQDHKLSARAIGISKATYYRYRKAYRKHGEFGLEPESRRPKRVRQPCWDAGHERAVRKIRRKFKLWGRAKIRVILAREYGMFLSRSTVGRILQKLVGQGVLKPVAWYFGRIDRRPRKFVRHAKRWTKELSAKTPGELVQIDHMKLFAHGEARVSFKGICPVTKHTVSQVYEHAKSSDAADFLNYLETKMPFKIKSIQVDGGSEFMGYFERSCQNKGIHLYVLPPKSPELNGNVERVNQTFKYEFYNRYDGPKTLSALRKSLEKYNDFYNEYRPHQALQQMTPALYFNLNYGGRPQSQMY